MSAPTCSTSAGDQVAPSAEPHGVHTDGVAPLPQGVKLAGELVKLLPSAEGHAGTTLSFGHWDRGALHGQYLVLRQWRDTLTTEIGSR